MQQYTEICSSTYFLAYIFGHKDVILQREKVFSVWYVYYYLDK